MVFTLVVLCMFVSLGSLTLYPTFAIPKFFGIIKSLWGVIIIRVFGLNVTNLFITRSYIRSISKEIDESAKVDGCSFFGIYRQIIFPLLKPLVATIAILEFRHSWNGYLMLAGSSIALVPMIIIFNRYFIEGFTAGSVKG